MFIARATPNDEQLMDAEISIGSKRIGRVQGLVLDPVSGRVRRLITSYGPLGRRVAVPLEWVTKRSPVRLELGVGTRSLDDLGDRLGA